MSADGLRIGIGLYEEGAPAEQAAAGDVPELQEDDGHLWRLAEVVESQPGDRSLELVDDTEAATLVFHYTAHAGRTLVSVLLDGEEAEATDRRSAPGPGRSPAPEPGTGTYGIRLGADASPRAALALAMYERID